tara:strand:+ start:20 stop:1408 length:1389 start_codon:yes stop_codon:yes gene_type:complete
MKIYIDTKLENHKNKIIPVFTNLFEISGLRVSFVNNIKDSDLVYSELKSSKKITIKSIPLSDWDSISKPLKLQSYKSYKVPKVFLNNDEYFCNEIDWVACTYYFLSGLHEKELTDLNEFGVPSSDIMNYNFNEKAIINDFALKIREIFSDQSYVFKPMWPNKKKYCVVLTHDVDRFIKYDFYGRLKLSMTYLRKMEYLLSMSSALKGSYSMIKKILSKDPYLHSIKRWSEFEKNNNLKSAYYIATTSCFDKKSSINDVMYKYNNKSFVKIFKNLHNDGWEIGLHTSINAYRKKLIFKEIEKFEEVFGFTPQGVRGHYWSSEKMQLSHLFTKQLSSKISYDSSLGMNDTVGFRRGISYPYKLFNFSETYSSDLYELPVFSQDLAYHKLLKSKNSSSVREIANNAKKNYGILVFDFHSDAFRKDFLDSVTNKFVNLLLEFINDTDCWIATPTEVINWVKFDRWK